METYCVSCKESTEYAKSRWLLGNVRARVAWVKLLCGLRGLRGSKYFLRGSTFYVGHNFLLRLRRSKNVSIGAFTIIS